MTLAEAHRGRHRLVGASAIRKRSIVIAGHKTSISLEDEFWDAVRAAATARRTTLSAVVGEIDEQRPKNANLASAIRVFVLGQAQQQITALRGDMSTIAHAAIGRRPPAEARNP